LLRIVGAMSIEITHPMIGKRLLVKYVRKLGEVRGNSAKIYRGLAILP